MDKNEKQYLGLSEETLGKLKGCEEENEKVDAEKETLSETLFLPLCNPEHIDTKM